MGSFLEQSNVRHQFVGVKEVLIDVVISQISDCSNEKVATIATTINSNDDCVAFITLSLEKKVRSLRISQDDVVETEYGVCNLEQNLQFKRQETFDLGRGRRRDFRKRRTTDAFSVKLLVVASSLVNLRGKQVLTVRTSKTSPRNSNGMQLYVGASTGPKPSPDTRTLK
uniref:Uncharacterized protein n=1 Tax=Vespula pensylvanica TaxID=30213 RepID=A0A834KQ90_VESPE|nr:hypothetical protein H0235_013227 [Vespula pensylvanica]